MSNPKNHSERRYRRHEQDCVGQGRHPKDVRRLVNAHPAQESPSNEQNGCLGDTRYTSNPDRE